MRKKIIRAVAGEILANIENSCEICKEANALSQGNLILP